MNKEQFFDGSIRPGHPLVVAGMEDEEAFFRSARLSPHSGSVLVCVAMGSGGIIAVEPEELSEHDDGGPAWPEPRGPHGNDMGHGKETRIRGVLR